MFPETIETESLVLQQLSPAHVDVFDLYDCFRAEDDDREGVFEYVPQDPFASVKDAHDWLVDAESVWDAGESAKYGIFQASDGVVGADDPLVGAGGVSLDWNRRTASPGLFLARPHWGRGYAGECAMALAELDGARGRGGRQSPLHRHSGRVPGPHARRVAASIPSSYSNRAGSLWDGITWRVGAVREQVRNLHGVG